MGLSGSTVLLIEDDPNVRRLLPRYFEREGAATLAAAGGLEGVDLALDRRPDLVLLDVNLPDIDGWSVLKRIRQSLGFSVGVIMLTGRSDVPDRLLGLELGADDYVVKPFEPQEVVARARAVQRRLKATSTATATGTATATASRGPALRAAGLKLDEAGRMLYVDGAPVLLTAKEFDLVVALMQNSGRVVTREALAARGWPDGDDVDPHAIDVYMNRIRSKLGPVYGVSAIITVRGVGYKFNPDTHGVVR
ncbi:MAG TPA: response regulator transcription factor [Bacillota bacterium]|nr:response regulator transcription factor [Bacillota bacterium]HNY68888.1 response regulator transcription factor [Bacillota bacterium]HOI38113.1 response regulator transcription factor [Bacillota bacterium]HPU76222.1 response regulator transcription factor [Bacillota bacterium]